MVGGYATLVGFWMLCCGVGLPGRDGDGVHVKYCWKKGSETLAYRSGLREESE